MAIKSFTVTRRNPRPSRSGLMSAAASVSAPVNFSLQSGVQARQHAMPYQVARPHHLAANVPALVADGALRECLHDLEERMVERVTSEISRLLHEQQIADLQAGAEASIDQKLPSVPPQHQAHLWQIEQNTRLRTEFMAQCDLFSSKQVADLLESKAKNRAATASHLKDKGKIFAVRLHGQDYFPAFQFDLANRRSFPEIAELIAIMQRDCEPGWQLALWFSAPNAWLDERTPLQVWQPARGAVLQAASAESAAFDA